MSSIESRIPSHAKELAGQWPDDVLPPEATYPSRESLLEAINKWAKPRGYAFVARRSNRTANGRSCVYFSCDRGGGKYTPIANTERKRNRVTQRTGCMFSVIGKESLCKTQWSLRHRPDPSYSHHNHGPTAGDGVAHTTHRSLANEDLLMVKKLVLAGVEQRQIKTFLLQNTDALFIDSDLSNCISRAKQDLANGQSHMVALLQHLDSQGFWSRHLIGKDYRLQSIIFAHPGSIQFARSYPEVLIVDCTYKTNKYRMPLLDIVGVDATGSTFCIAFAYLSGEEEEDFGWAFEQLRDLYDANGIKHPSVVLTDRCLACMNAVVSLLCFPSTKVMLCLWHINKAGSSLRHFPRLDITQGIDHGRSAARTDRGESPSMHREFLEDDRRSLCPCSYALNTGKRALVDKAFPFALIDDRRAALKSQPASQPASSTQRDPCAFEAVEKALLPSGQKKPPTCSRCHQQGHNRRSRLCLERFNELAADLAFLQREEGIANGEVIDIQSRSVSPAAASATPKATPTAVTTEASPTPTYYYLQEQPHRSIIQAGIGGASDHVKWGPLSSFKTVRG
ncbi:Uncharacterized protein HZ326_29452 [Fusarium oxysporum f. sp. albedinis]|nr:Uncharacterized protein HZ326_29452 [Fusarium oxysporum f. sp. albedinis]